MAERKEKNEERQNQILEAATNVFAHRGFNKARMDDIVEESGLSKGTLYWYFDSKDDIIIAILRRLISNEFSRFSSTENEEMTAAERLEDFADFMVKDIQRMMPLMPLFYDFYALGMRNKKIKKVLGTMLEEMAEHVKPVIQQGIDEGEFMAVDPHEASMAIAAMLEGTILVWIYNPEVIDLLRQTEAGMEVLLKGFLVREENKDN